MPKNENRSNYSINYTKERIIGNMYQRVFPTPDTERVADSYS